MMFVSIHHQWLQVWFVGVFLTGLIWARTVFCIDMGNIGCRNMVKIHLPHMYMIFVECYRKQLCSSDLQYCTKLFNTFRIRSALSSLCSKLFGSVAASSETLSFFLALIAEHLESFVPLLESCMQLPHLCFTASNGCEARPKIFRAFKTSIVIPSSFSNPLSMCSSIGR